MQAAHARFLQETLRRHAVPDVDVVFLIADFCFGLAREPEIWGLGQCAVGCAMCRLSFPLRRRWRHAEVM